MPSPNESLITLKRIPIRMSAEEIEALEHLARLDSRSTASMARIIYLAGLEQYAARNKARGRR